ncbi:MAG: glycosyltransferase family 4 protein [Pseudomonadota bacterium]
MKLAALPPVPVVMLGTDPAGKGGIATVVSVLRAEGLFARAGVAYIVSHGAGGAAGKAARMLGAMAKLLRYCLRRQAPIVHAHAASRASFYRKSLLLALARRCGCPTVFHLHGGKFEQFATLESNRWQRWWIRHTLEASDCVLALSESWAGFLRRYAPAATVELLPNAVALPPASACSSGTPQTILFLGRIEAAKGIFDLVDALAQLAPAYPAARLLVGGDGDAAALTAHAARAGVAARLTLLGWVDADARAAAMAQSQIFCLPSHDEGLPMAMLEAMAAGKAVVVTSVGGIPEAIQDGRNGVLVAPRDSAALARALAALFGGPQHALALGQAARASIEARYSAATMVETLARLYRRLDESRRK